MFGKHDSVRTKLKLDVNWKLSALALAFFPLLVVLGFWQLSRAEQKRDIQETLAAQQAQSPLSWQQYQNELQEGRNPTYRRVEFSGRLDAERSYLIENKILRGQLGFHVVTPLYLAGGEALLVNRGWLAGTGFRDQLPSVPTPTGEVLLSGWLVEPSQNWLLKEQPQTDQDWPRQRLAIDPNIAQAELERPIVSQMLQLGADSPAAFVIDWQPVNMSASKHQGYAVQWFSLAVALLVLTLFANSNLGAVLKDRFR